MDRGEDDDPDSSDDDKNHDSQVPESTNYDKMVKGCEPLDGGLTGRLAGWLAGRPAGLFF